MAEPLSSLEKTVIKAAKQHGMALESLWWYPSAFYV